MIFCAKNEDGTPTWKLILEGKKTVTRRMKPMVVGKVYAVQKAYTPIIGKIRVKSCMEHWKWREGNDLAVEANREGFNSYTSLMEYFYKQNIDIQDTFRIEFELVDICPGCEHKDWKTLGWCPCGNVEDIEAAKVIHHITAGLIDGIKSCSEFKHRGA